jgi:HEAT repeat protein
VAAHRLGSERLREVPNLLPVLLECSHASDELDPPPQGDDLPGYRPHGEVRGVAAFALGVLGGEEAQARLVAMLDDGYPAARYNAATGLARLGDPRGTEVLLEMLDPENQQAASDERRQADQEIRRRTVLLNGLEAVRQLAAHPGGTPSPPLQAAVAKLATDPLESIAAREVRSLIQRRATEVMRELQDNKN